MRKITSKWHLWSNSSSGNEHPVSCKENMNTGSWDPEQLVYKLLKGDFSVTASFIASVHTGLSASLLWLVCNLLWDWELLTLCGKSSCYFAPSRRHIQCKTFWCDKKINKVGVLFGFFSTFSHNFTALRPAVCHPFKVGLFTSQLYTHSHS